MQTNRINRIVIVLMSAFWLFFGVSSGYAQARRNSPDRLVQFSGVVVSAIDGTPLPFTTVLNTSRHHGTIADANGFFSFVAVEKDSIRFTSVGYRPRFVIIPDTIRFDAYSLVVPMEQDTVMLMETVIYPWPSKDKFREAFINLKLPESDADIVRKNFDLAAIREQARYGRMNADMNYRSLMQQRTSQLYSGNQVAPVNLLNPFAWAKFVKQLKRHKAAEAEEKQSQGYQDYESTSSGVLPEYSDEE